MITWTNAFWSGNTKYCDVNIYTQIITNYRTCRPPLKELSLIARFMGQHGAHLGPTRPRWAPCWPHEPCYLGFPIILHRRMGECYGEIAKVQNEISIVMSLYSESAKWATFRHIRYNIAKRALMEFIHHGNKSTCLMGPGDVSEDIIIL